MTQTTQNIVPLKTLVRASLSAVVVATILLVTVILPAEYNIDLLGSGKALGLDKFAATAAEDTPVQSSNVQKAPTREDEVTINIPAGKGLEYKLHMVPDSQMKYEWSVTGGELFFDFHGEPKGAPAGYYESFTLSTASSASGLFYAPFEGSHGWYWKNNGSKPLKINLKTSGSYEVIGLK